MSPHAVRALPDTRPGSSAGVPRGTPLLPLDVHLRSLRSSVISSRLTKPDRPENKLLQDLRIAVRGFRRTPAFAVFVLAILALGIGAAAAMFTTFQTVLI